MEIKLIHILGPVLATVAMLFYGRALVGRNKGRRVRVGPALILIVGAILFRQLTGDGTFLDRICLTLLDFGIALIIDSRYLAYHKSHPKVFWVPGLLALILSFMLYFMASLMGWTVSGMFDGSGESDIQSGQVMIELGPDDNIEEVEAVLEEFEAKYKRAFPHIDLAESEDLAQYYLVQLPEGRENAFLEAIRKDKENIDYADLNYAVRLTLPETNTQGLTRPRAYLANDPGMVHQWWLRPESTNAVHQLLRDNPPKRKARVAIIDTGVDDGHEDLTDIVGTSPGLGDKHGHGTHCAGLAGAHTHNGKGIASLNWEGRFVEILSYKALNDKGHGDLWTVAGAITRAAEDGVDVISLSLGSNRALPPKMQVDAVNYALKLGVIVVAAAGNDGDDAAQHSPANIEGVIAVGAVDKLGERARFSNWTTSLARPIAAPGVEIYATMPEGKYDYMSGTSMATPLVAGLLGVLRAYQPDLNAAAAWKLLHNHGRRTAGSTQVGTVIDPEKTISALLSQ
ncbi:MAG: S8 family serine peptidase [Bacteroidota bacterium]